MRCIYLLTLMTESTFTKTFYIFKNSIFTTSQKNKIIALIRIILAQNYH